MGWPPDAESVTKYNTTSWLIHNALITFMAVVALIYNKNGPVWIKGFIAAIVVSCVAGLLEVSLRVYLIFYFTN